MEINTENITNIQEEIQSMQILNNILKKNSEDFKLTEKEILFMVLNNHGYFSEESKEIALRSFSPTQLLLKVKKFDK